MTMNSVLTHCSSQLSELTASYEWCLSRPIREAAACRRDLAVISEKARYLNRRLTDLFMEDESECDMAALLNTANDAARLSIRASHVLALDSAFLVHLLGAILWKITLKKPKCAR